MESKSIKEFKESIYAEIEKRLNNAFFEKTVKDELSRLKKERKLTTKIIEIKKAS